jgi:hypothetical protein
MDCSSSLVGHGGIQLISTISLSLTIPVALGHLPLTKTDCGLTPAWQGIIWVVTLTHRAGHVVPRFIGGKWRQWGNLIVAGDEHLMDRLERLYIEMGP